MIKANNLYYSYDGDKNFAVSNASFKISAGEAFGLLGQIDAGKTTIIKLLSGLLRIQRGEVKIDNIDIRESRKGFSENIGVMFEKPRLYRKFTALENLRFFSSLYSKESEDPKQLLKNLDLKIDKKRKVSDFSLGELKRLGLARALVSKPKVLLLDSPLTGLDSHSQQVIEAIIKNTRDRGTTVFLTTSNPKTIGDLCDSVGIISFGEILRTSSIEDLLNEYGKSIIEIEYIFKGKSFKENLKFGNMTERERLSNIIRTRKIVTLHTKEASLEEIFFNIAGTAL